MSPNTHTNKKQVERGLTIFKRGRSRYWTARLWDRRANKYVTKSTGETDRFHATEAARSWKDAYLRKASSHLVDKANSEDGFEFYARMIPRTSKDDWVMLLRKDDGILAHFGEYDVKAITTGSMRQYLETLNENRELPLHVSTQKKHIGTIRKALRFARENGKIATVPEAPKLAVLRQEPRPNFSPKEFVEFLECIKADVECGAIDREFFEIVKFVPVTFLRPVESELMSLRVRDIQVTDKSEKYLTMNVKGKTRSRQAISLPLAVDIFRRQVARADLQSDDYLWYNDLTNRKYAITKFSRLFSAQLEKHGFKNTSDGQPRSAYSLRHFGITTRLQSSGGRVNIYTLASNAGTSVQMLERFYLRYAKPNQRMIKNLQYFDRE